MPDLILFIFVIVLLSLIGYYHWSRLQLYRFASKLPGPLSLPIIGNAYIFLGDTQDYLLKTMDLINIYGTIARFWLGPKLIITFTHPKHVSKILTSNKLADKHEVYEFMKPLLGNGLVSGSGHLWKRGRKCIQPLFDVKFVMNAVTVSRQHINVCIGLLEQYVNGDWFNVESVIHKCTIDIIGGIDFNNHFFGDVINGGVLESILGRNFQAQFGKNHKFQQMIKEMYDVIFPRLIKPWLHLDLFFNFTKLKQQQDTIVTVTTDIFDKAINNGRNILLDNDKCDGFKPLIVDIIDKYRKNSNEIDVKNLRDNLFTLYAASEDTITAIASAACVCFGMYPTYQQQAYDEIINTIDDFNNITFDDISKLSYLDRCIKDVLRLFPIAPLILRQCNDDFPLDDMVIPKNCGITIPIFNLHLNPEYWERPLEFYPDHFLPDAISTRHPFCYIPFSAGPRSCIGKLLGSTLTKLYIIRILKEYTIEAEGKYMDVYRRLKADISVRLMGGYRIKIKKRLY